MDEQREVKKEYNNSFKAQNQINKSIFGKDNDVSNNFLAVSQEFYIGIQENKKFSMVSKWDIEVGNINDELSYKNRNIKLMGREQELQWIQKFLDSPQLFKVSAINGAAGIGKSRLVYEFYNYNTQSDWLIQALNHKNLLKLDYDSILVSMEMLGKQNILFVIDDVLYSANDIGEWILNLYKEHDLQPNIKIRILLLEREKVSIEKKPYWFIGIENSCKCLSHEYFNYKDFLMLEALDDNILIDVFVEYVNAKKNNIDTNLAREKAGEIIRNLDVKSKNPLIIMYVADAWLRNPERMTWSRNEALDYIIEKENERLESVCSKDAELIRCVEKVCMFSIAVNEIGYKKNAPEFLQKDFEQISEKTRGRRIRSIFETIGCCKEELEIKLHLPEIVKEYYLLKYLENKIEEEWEEEYVQEFIQQAWLVNSEGFSKLISRIVNDFTYHSMVSFKRILAEPHNLERKNIIGYSDILREYSYYNEHIEKYYLKVVQYFDKNMKKNEDKDFRKILCDNYAVTLFNMAWWYRKRGILSDKAQEIVNKINTMCKSEESGKWCMICRGIYALYREKG